MYNNILFIFECFMTNKTPTVNDKLQIKLASFPGPYMYVT